jgi:hypothetical protein
MKREVSMFRRRRNSFLAALPLAFAVVATLGSARAADARPLGGELAQLAWRWLAAVVSPATPCGLGSMVDPNGQCVQVREQAIVPCGHGSMIDPNGQCVQVRAQAIVHCGLGPMIDPNGQCVRVRAQAIVPCGHGPMIDPDGRCVQ